MPTHLPPRGQNSEPFFKFQWSVLCHRKEKMSNAQQVNIIRGSFHIGFMGFFCSFSLFFFFKYTEYGWQHKTRGPLIHIYMGSFVKLSKTLFERLIGNKNEQKSELGFHWSMKQVGRTMDITFLFFLTSKFSRNYPALIKQPPLPSVHTAEPYFRPSPLVRCGHPAVLDRGCV